MRLSTVFILFSFLVFGCKKDIDNGVVPSEYLQEAQKFVGNYYGEFNGVELKARIVLDDQNRLIVKTFSQKNRQLLLENCPSQIGKLVSVDVKSEDKTVRAGNFEFDAKECGLPQDGIEIFPGDNQTLLFKVVKKVSKTRGGRVCTDVKRRNCTTLPDTVRPSEWIEGVFKKY